MTRRDYHLPAGARGDTTVRVLACVLDGATTMSEIVTALSRSKVTIHRHLTLLRADGLVRWEEGLHGTIRPDCRYIEGHWTADAPRVGPAARGA